MQSVKNELTLCIAISKRSKFDENIRKVPVMTEQIFPMNTALQLGTSLNTVIWFNINLKC